MANVDSRTKHRYCSSSKWIGCCVYSSMFYGCSNAQFGSVIVPTNEKLLLLNSSFEHCSVTHSPQNGTENAYSSGDVIASSVIFSDLSSSTTVGLAMRLSRNATLRATNCSFLNVNSSLVNEGLYGGAVSHIGNGFHFSYGCNYSNCSAGYAGGVNISQMDQYLPTIMFFIALQAIMQLGWDATDCGCDISSWGNKIYDEKVIFDSFVSSYSASTQPWRVTIGWTDRSEWLPLFPETAPYVFVSSIFGDDNKENCGFGGIPCETIRKGMLKRTNSQPLIVEEGSYIHNEIAVSSTNVTLRGEDPETSTLISSNTGEGKALLDVTVGYLSISSFTVIHSNKNSNPGSAVLRMRGNGKIEISDSIFRGEEAGSVASTTSMIILEGGETTMSSVSFSLFTSMRQLISFSTPSQLSVKSVVFDSVRRTVGNGAIFEGRLMNNEICEMNNMTFSGCECSEGNGGGIWMELERGSIFFVGNTSDGSGTVVFSGCEAKQKSASDLCGCGGGIYLWVGDETDTFALKRVRFNDCKASKGNNVFVNASRLIGLVNTTTIGFNLSLSDFDCARGSERSTTGDGFWIPLVVYLWSNLTTFAHVGGTEGADFSRCGFAENPCETIGQAVSVRFEEKNRHIELHTPFILKEELNLKGYEWMIMASLNGMSIALEQEGTGNTKGMIEVQTKALLSGICFAIPETLGSHEAVVQCDSGAFNMAECGVGAKRGAISISFLRVSGGQVTVNRLAVRSMEFSAGSLLKITEIGDENCALSMSESTFESIHAGEGSILLCEGKANVNVSDCTMKKVLSSKQNGGGVSILFSSSTKQKIVGIDNCTFDECAVLDGGGCGGGMFELISDSNVLKLTECSFSGCAAPSGEEEGFGGGIYLQLMEESIDFVVSAPIFPSSKLNAASHGRDLFIRSPNLKRSVSSDTFLFVEEADKGSMESMEGIDGDDTDVFIPLILFFREIEGKVYTSSQSGVNTVVCGFEEYPCLSIYYSLLRLGKSVEKIVYVKDAVDMKEEVDLSDVELRGDVQEKAVLCVQEIMDGERKKVMSTKSAMHIVGLRVEAPLALTNGTTVLIASDGVEGKIEIEDCLFTMKSEEEGAIDYTLIESKGSFLWLVGVRIANIKTGKSLFILCNKQASERNRENPSIQLKNCTFEGLEVQGADCSVLFESTLNVECLITENNMTNISSLESIEGGAMRCAL
ncbi:uncharacterized protein MONOS_10951 [Monocercomonoides exilis]|uniref:uncharacterized protein n=1 Tax=Monocercomonoides exilis TaxID=2049356 RepID=UPI00355A38F5|nr:hypothetical protein MONOS_10951 [Monocercomonoides exilis]|eukprot:MONOS_10951.1-p1 / transcript=MONOS_10951.1 / gene=MONOS_10951 / organism=Monocercomonoides_exilis_PA203 / gene_product=unspecified product / transcript_product=unspecified product / location=Mono_scaffold00521:9053-12968(-) / protein_length=1197 / sequence_SO=supercontig / SO=protein_coding / is_pseudo=false